MNWLEFTGIILVSGLMVLAVDELICFGLRFFGLDK